MNKGKSKILHKDGNLSKEDEVFEENEVTWMKKSGSYDYKFVNDMTSKHIMGHGNCGIGQQTLSLLTLKLWCPDIRSHPSELISIEFYPWHVEVKVKDIRDRNEAFIYSLAQEIECQESFFKFEKDIIKLILKKKKPWFWTSYFNPPAVIGEAKRKFIDVLNLSPAHLHPHEIFLDIRYEVEQMCNFGVDYLTLHFNTHNFENTKNTREVLKCGKRKIRAGCKDRSLHLHIAAAILTEERKEYVLTHPEFMKKTSKIELKSEEVKKKGKAEEKKKGKAEEIKEREEAEQIRKREKAGVIKERGNTHFRAERYKEAIEAYTEAIELDPDSALYYLNRCIAYFHLLNYSQSIKDAASSLHKDPFNGKTYFYLAKNFYNLGDFAALKQMEAAAYLEPFNKDIESYMEKILTFKEKLDYFIASDNALEVFDNFDPLIDNVPLVRDLCRTLIERCCIENNFHLGNDMAQSLYYTEHPALQQETFYGFSVCNFYEDCDEDAVHDSFKRCFAFQEEHPIASNNYEFIKRIYSCRKRGNEALGEGQFEEAIKWYSKALKPDDVPPVVCSNLLVKIAAANLGLGKRKEAISSLNLALDKNENCHQALAKRGECHLNKGEIGKAKKDFESAICIHPCKEYTDLLKRCTKTICSRPPTPSATKDVASAEICNTQTKGNFKREANNKPQNSHLVSEHEKRTKQVKEEGKTNKVGEFEINLAEKVKLKGNEYFKVEMYEDALRCYSEAISLNPESAVYYSNRSACHMIQKNYHAALADATAAVEKDRTFVKGLLRKGRCCNALGRPREAIAAFEQARELDSTNVNAVKGIEEARNLLSLNNSI